MDWLKSLVKPSLAKTDCWNATRTPLAVAKLRSLVKAYTDAKQEQEKLVQLKKVLALFVQLYASPLIDNPHILEQTYGETKELAHVSARFLVEELRGACKASNTQEQNARAVADVFSSADMRDVYDALDVLAYEANLRSLVNAALPSVIVEVFHTLLPYRSQQIMKRTGPELAEDWLLRMLMHCCKSDAILEELQKSDTLCTLFHIVAMPAPLLRASQLRKRLAQASMIVLGQAGDEPVYQYMHKMGTIGYQVSCFKNFAQFESSEGAALALTNIMNLLRRSCSVSNLLLEDFEAAQGYSVMATFLAYLDRLVENCLAAADTTAGGAETTESGDDNAPQLQDNAEKKEADAQLAVAMKVIESIGDFVWVGSQPMDLPEEDLLVYSPYNEGNLPPPASAAGDKGKEGCIRNLEAFKILQNFVLEGKNTILRLRSIDAMQATLSASPANWWIVQSIRPLAPLIEQMDSMDIFVQQALVRLLVYIATVHNFVPFQELASLFSLLQTKVEAITLELIVNTAKKLLQNDTKYTRIFVEAGLLDQLVACFHRIDSYPVECLGHLLNLTRMLLNPSFPGNFQLFRQAGGDRMLLTLLLDNNKRLAALRVVRALIRYDRDNISKDIHKLVELLHSGRKQDPVTSALLRRDILAMLAQEFEGNTPLKVTLQDAFREAGGFMTLISSLASLERRLNHTANKSSTEGQAEEAAFDRNLGLELMRSVFSALALLLSTNSANRQHFRDIGGYTGLVAGLELSGVLGTAEAWDVAIYMLSLSAYRSPALLRPFSTDKPTRHQIDLAPLRNGEAVVHLLSIMPKMGVDVQRRILRLLTRLSKLSLRTCQTLFAAGVAGLFLRKYSADNPLNPEILRLVTVLGSFRLSVEEWRQFMRLAMSTKLRPSRLPILQAMSQIGRTGQIPPFVELKTTIQDTACLQSTWPSEGWPAGFSLLFWFYVDYQGSAPAINLLTIKSDNGSIHLSINLTDRALMVQTTSGSSPAEVHFPWHCKKWYHLALVTSRKRFQSPDIHTYVDGSLLHTSRMGSASRKMPSLSFVIGTATPTALESTPSVSGSIDEVSSRSEEEQNSKPGWVWRAGQLWVLEDELNDTQIATSYCLGPSYKGVFRPPLAAHLPATVFIKRSTPRLAGVVESRTSFSGDSFPTRSLSGEFKTKPRTGSDAMNLPIQSDRVLLWYCPRIVLATDKRNTHLHIPNGGRGYGGAEPPHPQAGLHGGATAFHPLGLADAVRLVGGPNVLLALIADAQDTDELLCLLELLGDLLPSHPPLTREFEHLEGYRKLALILKRKTSTLSIRCLAKLFNLSTTSTISLRQAQPLPVNTPEAAAAAAAAAKMNFIIINSRAFADLACNFELWEKTEGSMVNLVSFFLELVSSHNPYRKKNLHTILNKVKLVPLICRYLHKGSLPEDARSVTMELISALLSVPEMLLGDLQHVCDLVVTLLLGSETVAAEDMASTKLIDIDDAPTSVFHNGLRIGVAALEMLVDIVSMSPDNPVLHSGPITPEWMLALLDGSRDRALVVHVMQLLCGLIQASPTWLAKFRASYGFEALEVMLLPFAGSASIILFLLALLLDRPVANRTEATLDRVALFTAFSSPKQSIGCREALEVLLVLVKGLADRTDSSPTESNPEIMLEFLLHLFDSARELRHIFDREAVVVRVTGLLFPQNRLNSEIQDLILQAKEEEKKSDDGNESTGQLALGLLLRVVDRAVKETADAVSLINLILDSAPHETRDEEVLVFRVVFLTAVAHHFMRSMVRDKNKQETAEEKEKLLLNLAQLANLLADETISEAGVPMSLAFNFAISLLRFHFNVDTEEVVNDNSPDMEPKRIAFRALNRLCLTMIQAKDEVKLLESLQEIVDSQRVLFAPSNSDKEFVAQLCLQLAGFLLHDNADIRSLTANTFKLLLLTKEQMMSEFLITRVQGRNIDLMTDGFDRLLSVDLAGFSFWAVDAMPDIRLAFTLPNDFVARLSYTAENLRRETYIAGVNARRQSAVQQAQANASTHTVRTARTRMMIKSILQQSQERELSELQKQKEKTYHDVYEESKWLESVHELYAERALWGSTSPSPYARWKLDQVEGPQRIRRLLVPDTKFWQRYYDEAPDHSEVQVVDYKDFQHEQEHGLEFSNPFTDIVPQGTITDTKFIPPLTRRDSLREDGEESGFVMIPRVEEAQPEDCLGLIRALLGMNDKSNIEAVHECQRVEGQEKPTEGILLICARSVYVIDGFRRLPTGQIVPRHGNVPPTPPHVIKWAHKDVAQVLRRRYLLRPVAIEVFTNDGYTHLLVFDEQERDSVFKSLYGRANVTEYSPESLSTISPRSGGSDSESFTKLSGLTLPFDLVLWRRSSTEKWQNGQLTNFQYLMHLNTLAGRSYHDMSQYPVFPWVLADHTSSELDLKNPVIYRDLSKPMGALTPARAEKFIERYQSWQVEEQEGVPKWHYGTHYSSAGIVALYMLRLEPFTQHYLHLQNGRFDVADRLFHSFAESWESSSGSGENYSLTDVRELTPEFFFLPEFLENINKFDMGTKHTGEQVWDLILPPWAKGNPRRFVDIHRAALESDYVSEHLHEWIDLVFGCKQKGQAAEDALNVFYYLTYEGVDLNTIKDPLKRAAMISQVYNYGQTPTQLFTKPHPRRRPVPRPRPIDPQKWVPASIAEAKSKIGQLRRPDKKLLVLTNYKIFVPPKCKQYLAWGFSDFSLRMLATEGEKNEVVWDNVEVWGQLRQVAISEDGRNVVTAGTDTTVSVFRLIKKDAESSLILIKRLYAHVKPVTAVLVSRAHSIILSASEAGDCVVWDLNRLQYIRTIGPMDQAISTVALHEVSGDIVTCAGGDVAVWTINGRPLYNNRTQKASSPITAVTMTQSCEWSPEHTVYITGHQDGSITFWGVGTGDRELVPIITFADGNSPITALLLTKDEKMLYSGDAQGAVKGWADEEHHEMERLYRVRGPTSFLRLPAQASHNTASSLGAGGAIGGEKPEKVKSPRQLPPGTSASLSSLPSVSLDELEPPLTPHKTRSGGSPGQIPRSGSSGLASYASGRRYSLASFGNMRKATSFAFGRSAAPPPSSADTASSEAPTGAESSSQSAMRIQLYQQQQQNASQRPSK